MCSWISRPRSRSLEVSASRISSGDWSEVLAGCYSTLRSEMVHRNEGHAAAVRCRHLLALTGGICAGAVDGGRWRLLGWSRMVLDAVTTALMDEMQRGNRSRDADGKASCSGGHAVGENICVK